MQQNITNDRIVLYDSDCVLCTRTIRFLLKIDRKNKLKFASLSSSTSKLLNLLESAKAPTSVVFYDKGKKYYESTAALQIIRQMPFPWKLLYIFIIIPSSIRDTFYQWVARNRYKWFGKTNSCDLNQTEYAGKILD